MDEIPADDGLWRNRIVGLHEQPADQFLFNPSNPREHPQAQRRAVAGSLESLGWVAPVIVNARTGYLLDGHERIWQALQRGDGSPVPFVLVDLSEEEEAQFLLTFDAITGLAAYDRARWQALRDSLPEIDPRLRHMLDDMRTDRAVRWHDGQAPALVDPDTSEHEPAAGGLACPKCGFLIAGAAAGDGVAADG